MGSTSVASVAASSVLLVASGVVCDSSLFSLEIAVSKKLLTSDGARTKNSVSLIKQVAFVEQQLEAFGLQGRVVDVAHVGQAHPCYKSRTAEYPLERPTSNVHMGPNNVHNKIASLKRKLMVRLGFLIAWGERIAFALVKFSDIIMKEIC